MYMQALLGPATFGLQIPLVHVTEDVIAEIVNLALKLLDLKSVSSSYSNSINFIHPKKRQPVIYVFNARWHRLIF